MIWPPVKAWTSKTRIKGQEHFVAINYGGSLLDRWVILISVIDSGVVVKVPFTELTDSSNWKCGWSKNNYLSSCELVSDEYKIINTNSINPSVDSGLTIPITEKNIRPWFADV
tara:strand:- start:905 stop:1243 length:339 start_codon:yes stop_codon:yes gene_type:complete